MNETRIFFDLDGVLADMDGALGQNPAIRELRSAVDELIETKFTDYKGLVNDDIKTKFKAELEANPDSPVRELKKAFQKYNSKVFSIAARPGFYRNLPLMPGAAEMVKRAAELTGNLPNILSAPVGDENDPNNPSVIEKREWVEEHFGGMVGEVTITVDKGGVVESKNDILIDDRPKYVDKFTSAGGTAILHTDFRKTLAELESILSGMQTNERRFVRTYEGFRKK